MALMHTVIETPEMTHWATNAGRVLDPDDTLGDTVPIVQEDGFEIDTRPPAKVMNWILNLAHLWTVKTVSSVASNWVTHADVAATPDLRTVEYSPLHGVWYANDGTTSVWKSYDGKVWSAAGALGNIAKRRSAGHDTTRILVGDTNNDLEYSSSASLASWSTITAATMGISADIYGIGTKAPDSDFLIIVTEGCGVKIAASGATGGSWVSPSVAPAGTGVGASQNVQRIMHMGDSTWALLSSEYAGSSGPFGCWTSIDDGDNWVSRTLDFTPYAGGHNYGPRDMAYSEDTGRLVVCGRDNTGPTRIIYSDNLGVTWTRAVVAPYLVAGTQPEPTLVYYCGGNVWIGATNWATAVPDIKEPGLIISTDNAETWDTLNMDGVTTDRFMAHFACDGKMIVGVGESGMTMSSLALA